MFDIRYIFTQRNNKKHNVTPEIKRALERYKNDNLHHQYFYSRVPLYMIFAFKDNVLLGYSVFEYVKNKDYDGKLHVKVVHDSENVLEDKLLKMLLVRIIPLLSKRKIQIDPNSHKSYIPKLSHYGILVHKSPADIIANNIFKVLF